MQRPGALRDLSLRINDIQERCNLIANIVLHHDFDSWLVDSDAYHASIRHLEVIGEAVKGLPKDATALEPTIDWNGFSRMRDVLIHQYFGLTDQVIWDTMVNEVPLLSEASRRLSNSW